MAFIEFKRKIIKITFNKSQSKAYREFFKGGTIILKKFYKRFFELNNALKISFKFKIFLLGDNCLKEINM